MKKRSMVYGVKLAGVVAAVLLMSCVLVSCAPDAVRSGISLISQGLEQIEVNGAQPGAPIVKDMKRTADALGEWAGAPAVIPNVTPQAFEEAVAGTKTATETRIRRENMIFGWAVKGLAAISPALGIAATVLWKKKRGAVHAGVVSVQKTKHRLAGIIESFKDAKAESSGAMLAELLKLRTEIPELIKDSAEARGLGADFRAGYLEAKEQEDKSAA